MENMLSKDTLVRVLEINTKLNELDIDPKAIYNLKNSFFKNSDLNKSPDKLLELLDVGAFESGSLNKDVLWKLSSLDESLSKDICESYSVVAINKLMRLYDEEDILADLCKYDKSYVNKLLSFRNAKHFTSKMHYSSEDILNLAIKSYVKFIYYLVKKVYTDKGLEQDKEKYLQYIEYNSLDIIDILLQPFYGYSIDVDKNIMDSRAKKAADIVVSELFSKLDQLCFRSVKKLDTLMSLWISDKISKDALMLIEDMVCSMNTRIYAEDMAKFISIINSKLSIDTNFKYEELKAMYQDDLYELMTNLLGNGDTLILQKEVNMLLKNKADVKNPYGSIYDIDSIEYKIFNNIVKLGDANSSEIKMMIKDNKSKCLEVLFKDYQKDADDEVATILSMINSRLVENYKYLDKLIHLNNLNDMQLRKVVDMNRSDLIDISKFLSKIASVKTLPESLCDKYGIQHDLPLYSNEKFNFEEFMILRNSSIMGIRVLMLIMKRLKIKNSKVINICNEVMKLNDGLYIGSVDAGVIADIAVDYNSLYQYREKNPINNIPIKKIDNIVFSILHEDELNKINIKSENDIEFIRLNKDDLDKLVHSGVDDLNEIKKSLCLEDRYMSNVLRITGVDDEFIKDNIDRIVNFYSRGLAPVVYKLKDTLRDAGERNLPLIVKAELAGALKKIKYLPEDYLREIGMEVTDKQRAIWEENSEHGLIKEADDFSTTILIGQYPVETCQHWQSERSYVQSLLSNFDTNKKIIVHKGKDGRIDTRAILRLTRMSKDEGILYTAGKGFGFRDVTEMCSENNIIPGECKEELVLFLEACYSSLDIESKMEVMKEMIDFANKKAKSMGIKLVISYNYEDLIEEDSKLNSTYKKESCYIYISKSKNGMQYLDSVGGQSTSTESERYVKTMVYM